MNAIGTRHPAILAALISVALAPVSRATLDGYWPVNETTGFSVDNLVPSGTDASLFNGATFFTDPTRGQVLAFDGIDGYANAGTIPTLTLANDYTWSFWVLNENAANTTVILGNRYNELGPPNDYAPREFTKFTPVSFEYHRNGTGENFDYPDLANPSGWTHMSVVKTANHFISYQNGVVNGVSRITLAQNSPHPFYFGGDQTAENWTGKLDDVAVWSNALPASSIAKLAKGTVNPATAPLTSAPLQTVFSDSFQSGLTNWTPTNRGLENNAPAGYNAPVVTGGQVSLSGTTNSEFWYGNSIESNAFYSSSVETLISVDRISLSGTGTAFRSSLWVLGDDAHFLHFAQNMGETGWQFNARDDGGLGTLNPNGSGFNIAELDSLDGDLGTHSMSIRLVPTGTIGEVNMFMFLDGGLVAARGFTNFPEFFSVALTGQARAINDTVNAVFDNVVVQQVPEPSSGALFLSSVFALGCRRRKA